MKIIQKRELIIGVLAPLLLPVLSFAAGNNWQVEVRVKQGPVYQRLVLGVAPDATDAFDRRYETFAFFWGGEPFKAYFFHRAWNKASDYYWRDIRASSKEISWRFYVDVEKSGNMEILWSVSPSSTCGNIELVVLNSRGQLKEVVDMLETPLYSFYAIAGEQFQFIVRYRKSSVIVGPATASQACGEATHLGKTGSHEGGETPTGEKNVSLALSR